MATGSTGTIKQDLRIVLNFETGKWKQQTAQAGKDLDDLNQRFRTTAGSANKLSKNTDSFYKALKLVVATSAFKFFKDTALEIDRVTNRMKFATDSTEEFTKAMELAVDTASNLGLALVPTQRGLATLQASAKGTSLAGKEIEELFKGISQASGALSLTADETNSVFLAFSQIISKGKVQAEELRSQIGERIPGALEIAQRALGVTGAELDKLLQNGELMADDLLPKLSREFQKTFSEDAVKNANSLTAVSNKLTNEFKLMSKYIATLTLEDTGLIEDLSKVLDVVKEIREGDKEITQVVSDSLSQSPKIFDDIADYFGLEKVSDIIEKAEKDEDSIRKTLNSIAGDPNDYKTPTFSQLLGLPDADAIEEDSAKIDKALNDAIGLRKKLQKEREDQRNFEFKLENSKRLLSESAERENLQQSAIDNYKKTVDFQKLLLDTAELVGKKEKENRQERIKNLRQEQRETRKKISLLKEAQSVEEANQVNFLNAITRGSNQDIKLQIEARTRALGATAGNVEEAEKNARELEEQTRILEQINEKLDLERV